MTEAVRRPESVAVVTGASRNIGAAISIALAAAGFAVAVNYHSPHSHEDAEMLVRNIVSSGGVADAFQGDIASSDQVTTMFTRIVATLGKPSVLVNNAAASVSSNMGWDDIDEISWDAVMATNLKGTFLCSRAVSRCMRELGSGSIINISSIRVPLGKSGNLHYTTTKAGILGFTRTLARELGPLNIRVNSLVVGAIQTADEAVYGDPKDIDASVIAEQSLKRRGVPADVANAVVFLSGAASSFITGQSIIIDGGWAMS
jgi:3-oxoacyl-[acyl-carrier protein] reductase